MSLRTCAAPLLLLSIAIPLPAAPVKLQAGAAVNDRAYVQVEGDSDMEVRIDGGPPISTTHRKVEKFTERTLDVRAGAQAAVRRKYDLVRTALRAGSGPLVLEKSPLTGVQVELRGPRGSVDLKLIEGGLQPAAQEELRQSWEPAAELFFPELPVEPGDEWEDPAPPGEIQEGRPERLKARLEEITTFAGRPAARMSLSGTLRLGESEDETDRIPFTGESYHALDIHRHLYTVIEGAMTTDEATRVEGREVRITGAGRFKYRTTHTWLEVAGRNVYLPQPDSKPVVKKKKKTSSRRRRSYRSRYRRRR